MKKLFLIGLVCLFTTSANAHSKVDTTTPENGAELSEVPKQVSFVFGKKIRLTKVDMTHATHPTVSLDLNDQNGFGKEVSVPLEGMGAGTYRIEWRGLGADGHPMQGDFMFEVK